VVGVPARKIGEIDPENPPQSRAEPWPPNQPKASRR